MTLRPHHHRPSPAAIPSTDPQHDKRTRTFPTAPDPGRDNGPAAAVHSSLTGAHAHQILAQVTLQESWPVVELEGPRRQCPTGSSKLGLSRCGSGTELIMARTSPFSVRFGSSQCSRNDSGRISGDLSSMCPKESVACLVKTVQVHTHLRGSSSDSSGSGHNSQSPATAITSPYP